MSGENKGKHFLMIFIYKNSFVLLRRNAPVTEESLQQVKGSNLNHERAMYLLKCKCSPNGILKLEDIHMAFIIISTFFLILDRALELFICCTKEVMFKGL